MFTRNTLRRVRFWCIVTIEALVGLGTLVTLYYAFAVGCVLIHGDTSACR